MSRIVLSKQQRERTLLALRALRLSDKAVLFQVLITRFPSLNLPHVALHVFPGAPDSLVGSSLQPETDSKCSPQIPQRPGAPA